MHDEISTDELSLLRSFALFATQKGYNISAVDDSVIIRDVTNPNNNFKIFKRDDYYLVYTICVSPADYEYTARCMVYLLLAEYNQANGDSTHLHLNFKVEL
jgi:hypothetical protein